MTLNVRTGFLFATLIWFGACIIGAIPYLISGTMDNFIDAVFEAASGFTTTGATVIDDFTNIPKIILFWRSLTHWLGGMGIVVLAAIVPMWGIKGQIIAYAETPGPSKGKLTAKFADTARDLYTIYIDHTHSQHPTQDRRHELVRFSNHSFQYHGYRGICQLW